MKVCSNAKRGKCKFGQNPQEDKEFKGQYGTETVLCTACRWKARAYVRKGKRKKEAKMYGCEPIKITPLLEYQNDYGSWSAVALFRDSLKKAGANCTIKDADNFVLIEELVPSLGSTGTLEVLFAISRKIDNAL